MALNNFHKPPIILIHGGAWKIPDHLLQASLLGVQRAAEAGWELLESGGNAVDAVEKAVMVMENDPAFDAGIGSVLTAQGRVEMDAMIMDGQTLKCGAVACVENIQNPVKLARKVMENTDHVMLVAQGANQFAREINMEFCDVERLVTKEALKQWEEYRKYKRTVSSLFSDRGKCLEGHDTVGSVARDMTGSLASATSTGGITAKRPGRIGDSPLIGSGGYADDLSCAISCTGHGESIMKICLAKSVADGCKRGETAQESLKTQLDYMKNRIGGAGGGICIGQDGTYGYAFTTERMAWALISTNIRISGINPGDEIKF